MFSNVERNNKEGVSEPVISLVNIINEVAEPLFKRKRKNKPHGTFKYTLYKQTKWFDNECREKKTKYYDALRVYNTNKTGTNRIVLFEKGKVLLCLRGCLQSLFNNCGSLLLLVLAVRIYTLVHLLC